MATPLTYSHRPIPFAIPALHGTAILPQTVALGVDVTVKRSNDKYFLVMAKGSRHMPIVAGARKGYVWWDEQNERWAVERHTYGEPMQVFARFRDIHLRQALLTSIIDTACEYVEDRDDLG